LPSPVEDNLKEIRRFQKDSDLCMKCGFCMSSCPVYKEDLIEASVARGRNAMVRGLIKGELEFTHRLAEIIDKCTLCKTCSVNCPAHVDIPAVVIAARADKYRKLGLKFPYNLVYRSILPRRVLFGRVVRLAGIAQKLFFPKSEGTLRHLPLFVDGMLGKGRNIPTVAKKFLRQQIPEVNSPLRGVPIKYRVGYMTGCITDYIFPETGLKLIKFLNRQGVEVIVPRKQGCCGVPVYMGAGDFDIGRKMADTNSEAFKGLDYVIVDCASCGSAIKEYEKYLADTDDRKLKYSEFGNKVIHITAFLTDVLRLPPSAYTTKEEFKGKSVTWHDPCHLNRYMGVKEQPRKILNDMKEIKYIEMADADKCCGMAGGFSMKFYDTSKKIADRKTNNIQNSGADIVVTGCPGCQIQLLDTAARHKLPIKVMHIMDLLE
jgi:glycolate oxidase iron-sulfur subunit